MAPVAKKVGLLLAAALVGASALRRNTKATPTGEPGPATAIAEAGFVGPKMSTVAQGEPGQVDYLFTFGAPGAGSPGLQGQRADRCTPGMRIYHVETGAVWGEWVDVVARITNLAYYWHAWTESLRIDEKTGDFWFEPCNEEQTRKPSHRDPLSWSKRLHGAPLYIDSVSKIFVNPFYLNISIFAARSSYIRDPQRVYQMVQQHGWGLVGSALHPGTRVWAGPQITHLIQHPDSNECVLTFQGTDENQDWMSNIWFPAAHFCGLVEQGEECDSRKTCTTRNSRGSFVHEGFRDRLMLLLRTAQFQNNVRPHLSKCSRITAAGHSLGGALAELFMACASKAPQKGQYGYDDYKYMSWTNGASARLPFIGQA